MFDRLFKDSRTIARHEGAPYAEERRRFLEQYAQKGYPAKTLRVKAWYLLTAVLQLRSYNHGPITLNQIRTAIDQRIMPRLRSKDRALSAKTVAIIRGVARHWLRFIGRFYEPALLSTTTLGLIAEFAAWMEHERGFTPRTISQRCRDIKYFLEWFEPAGRPLSTLHIQDVDAYLVQKGTAGWGRRTVSNQAYALKVFLRYAGQRGWCATSLAEAVRGPRVFFQEALPTGPTWADVQRLIARMDTSSPRDIRDRAAVMLLAVYGLRVNEVVNLRLEDIDWQHDLISVSRTKQRLSQTYPLVPVVGNAIIKYLQTVRPNSSRREVFLAFKSPVRPLSQSLLHRSITRQVAALGIHVPHTGPHSLRHACATHLVRQGFSLKEIGDHLGHRSLVSTRIYAKVDLAALREVAAFDLGGIL
jgi:integrase/recombinase XerD